MEMHQVRYFLAVATELNFTRASETCHVSQPSLTRAIKLLEEELGGPLFHRERANTHISELGRTVLPYLKQVYQGAEDAKRQAGDFVRLQKTPLRLGLMCTIAPALLLDLVSAVQMRHPGVALQILDAAAPALRETVDKVLSGKPAQLVLQVERLSFMASAGLRILIFAKQKQPNLKIYLVKPQPAIVDTLRKTGFYDGVYITDNEPAGA